MVDETLVDATPDIAVLVTREEGRWDLTALPVRVGGDLATFLDALRAQPAESGAIGLATYGDDFFLALRVTGGDVRMLISDAAAAADWPIAEDVLEELDVPLPDEDEEDAAPAGDLGIFADLGMQPMDMSMLCDDDDLYPDEMLGTIATRLGFGPAFEGVLDGARG